MLRKKGTRRRGKPCTCFLYLDERGTQPKLPQVESELVESEPDVPLYSRVVEVIGSRVPRELKASTIGHNRKETTPDKGGGEQSQCAQILISAETIFRVE